MNLRCSAAIAAIVALAATAWLGCSQTPGPVPLDGAWPDRPTKTSLTTATQEWTRRGDIWASLSGNRDHVLEVHATLKSPRWRAAYVEHTAKIQRLEGPAREQLLKDQRSAEAEGYEVELLVATYDRRANDLQKNKRSIWRIVLRDDQGNTIFPDRIKRDRRARPEIRAEFPHLTEFHVAYVAQFPRSVPLLRDGARSITLTMTSAQGAVDLVWAAK